MKTLEVVCADGHVVTTDPNEIHNFETAIASGSLFVTLGGWTYRTNNLLRWKKSVTLDTQEGKSNEEKVPVLPPEVRSPNTYQKRNDKPVYTPQKKYEGSK